MSRVYQWFAAWLLRHQDRHRHRDWIEHDNSDYYRGWVQAFEKNQVTEAEADDASIALQETGTPHPDKHVPVLLNQIKEQRRLNNISPDRPTQVAIETTEDFLRARAVSHGCPECTEGGRPTGWARRRFLVHEAGIVLTGSLYCRCKLGRFREFSDPERDREYRNYSDLQALPDLWHPKYDHKSWDWESVRAYHRPDARGRYLAPGEPVPPGYRTPSPTNDVARKVTAEAKT